MAELVQWFKLIEQIHLLQMADLKLLEVIWADSIEIETILEFLLGKCAIHRSSFQSSSMKKKKKGAQSNSGSPFFSKSLYKFRVMIYRISLRPNWFELARPAQEKCPELLTWKTGTEGGSSRISISIGDFHPQQRLLSEQFLVGSGITWNLITFSKEGEFPQVVLVHLQVETALLSQIVKLL